MSGEKRPQFVIVQFKDRTVKIIRIEWASFDEAGNICSTIFPDVLTERELEIFLTKENIPDHSWYDSFGYPYEVIRIFGYADDFEGALFQLDYAINWSDVNVNEETKLKRFTVSESKTEATTSSVSGSYHYSRRRKFNTNRKHNTSFL